MKHTEAKERGEKERIAEGNPLSESSQLLIYLLLSTLFGLPISIQHRVKVISLILIQTSKLILCATAQSAANQSATWG